MRDTLCDAAIIGVITAAFTCIEDAATKTSVLAVNIFALGLERLNNQPSSERAKVAQTSVCDPRMPLNLQGRKTFSIFHFAFSGVI